jgi:hypothetical protein
MMRRQRPRSRGSDCGVVDNAGVNGLVRINWTPQPLAVNGCEIAVLLLCITFLLQLVLQDSIKSKEWNQLPIAVGSVMLWCSGTSDDARRILHNNVKKVPGFLCALAPSVSRLGQIPISARNNARNGGGWLVLEWIFRRQTQIRCTIPVSRYHYASSQNTI